MKFITEEELRDLYKRQPFTNYELRPGERLTPGARQFLVDRGIDMYDRKEPSPGKKTSAPAQVAEAGRQRFRARLKILETNFLLTAEELVHRDIHMAEQVTELYRQFKLLGKEPEETCGAGTLSCRACGGINSGNFAETLGDCFEISEFHMQTAKGREMLLLASLRAQLQELELEPFLEDEAVCGQVRERLNPIINTLSQMICGALGGKECQRNM